MRSNNTPPLSSSLLTLIALLAGLLVSACGGGGGAGPTAEPAPLLLDKLSNQPDPLLLDQASSEPMPTVLELLKAEADLIAPVPDIAYTQTMANTGLQISFTDESLRARASSNSIETQWVHMQDCLQQTAVAPLVIVREGLVEPFTASDDVVRNEQISAKEIISVPVTSASTLHGTVIQVSVADFDGSLGTPLFNLRSIMGRHLWLSANLPERDYPFTCARQAP